ncbi:hypothetical protein [Lewinella sp. LCG006]|uniref:hypothetical protein n=1 Tax=Lewinella sp. LCG006 TaxID=3231911 RepID=UPI00345FD1CE
MKILVWTTTSNPSMAVIPYQEERVLNNEWVNVSVTFGDPRKNCSGSGVCQIMGPGQLNHPSCQGARVNGYINFVDNKCLQVIYDGRQFSLQEKKRYFPSNKIIVRTDLPLPFEIAKALGISENARISKGEYLIHQDGYYLHHYVRFNKLFRRS